MQKSRIIIALFLTVAAIIAATVFFSPRGPLSGVPTTTPPGSPDEGRAAGRVIPIDAAALQRLIAMDPNLVLIDVRKTEERTGPLGSIPNSLNIPMKKLPDTLEPLPRDKTLVFICHSGPRSLKAARMAAALGLTSYYVKGGMVAWRRMQRLKGKDDVPASPRMTNPEEEQEQTPFLGRDMGC